MDTALNTMPIRQLTAGEIDEVAGGPIPFVAAVTIVIAAAAAGYKTGADNANRKNAEDANAASDNSECTCN